jgi:hypothetical protein
MKKTYEILIEGRLTNDYIRGCIRGIIYALTGMPEEAYVWGQREIGAEWTMCFDATEAEYRSVWGAVNKLYPKAFIGIKEIG